MLIGKVLLNLGNRKLFGNKESFMIPMNAFIENNEKTVDEWYAKIPQIQNPPELFDVPPKLIWDSIGATYDTIKQFEDEIYENLKKKTQAPTADRLKNVLEELNGKAVET